MLRPSLHSLSHAFRGLWHALWTERNFRLFVVVTAIVYAVAWRLGVGAGEWVALLLASGTFLAVELLNTALEHMTDLFDEHVKGSEFARSHYPVIKAVKDVASAAALVSGATALAVAISVLWPHLTA